MKTTFLTMTIALASVCATSLAQESDKTASAATVKPQASSSSSALQVVDLGQGVSVTQRGRGRLLVVSDTWDFGFVPQDAQVTHRYVLENEGDDTLFIEAVKPTCGCTSAPLTRDRLAPGEKVPVDVTFSSKKVSGLLTKKVNVISSDSEASKYELTFTAHVGDPMAVGLESGSLLNFSQIPVDEHSSTRLPLTNQTSGAVTVRIADGPPAYLKASLSAASLLPKESAQLVVETLGAPPVGKFSGSVTVDLLGAQNTRLTIPITGVGTTK